METLFQFIAALLTIYIICVFLWALMSWLPMISPGLAYNDTVVTIRRFLDSVVLPYVRLFGFIKPVQIGNSLVDLSALVAILVLIIVQSTVLPTLQSGL